MHVQVGNLKYCQYFLPAEKSKFLAENADCGLRIYYINYSFTVKDMSVYSHYWHKTKICKARSCCTYIYFIYTDIGSDKEI